MSLELIKQLRDETGAGINDVKKALDEAGDDMEKAREILRKMGLKLVEKKQGREASEGIIGTYIHPPGKIVAVVVLNCETDFVARNDEFKVVAHEIAKQVAAMSPVYVFSEDVPTEEVDKEKEIQKEILAKEGKSVDMIDKIVEGKIAKYFEQVCLLEQSYILNDKMKVKDLLTDATAKLGEKIEIREFARFVL